MPNNTGRQVWTLFGALAALLATSAFAIADSGRLPGVKVNAGASWQLACGRSFIKQRVTVVNGTAVDWCIRRSSCNGGILFHVVDERGTKVAFGICARSVGPQSFPDVFNQVKAGDTVEYYYGGKAVIIESLDAPDKNLDRTRTYTASASLSLVPCDRARALCTEGCQAALEREMQELKLHRIAVPFVGESCPPGFDPNLGPAPPDISK